MLNRTSLDKREVAANQNVKERDYWLDKLSGELIRSSFPIDIKKTGVTEKITHSIPFRFDGELYSRLIKLSKGVDHTLHMILAAGLILLLHRYTGSSDVIVSMPIYKQEAEGEFINTILTLRNQVKASMTFKELLIQVKQVIIEANEHQNYPIESLLYKLNMPLSGNQFPLFDVVILLENIHDKRYIHHIDLNTVFSFKRSGECIEGIMEYNASLYRQSTIKRIVTHLANLLHEILTHIDVQVSQVNILSNDEKNRILYEFNDTRAEYSRTKTVHQLFEEQAAASPGNIAVTSDGSEITYRQLNEKSNRLARALRSKGVKNGTFVAVVIDRTIAMVVAVMGVLKSGGAYVPLEPDLPQARSTKILASLDVGCVLTNRLQLQTAAQIAREVPGLTNIFCLDPGTALTGQDEELLKEKEWIMPARLEEYPGENLTPLATAEDIAYVIYTSGSTGTPKGVVEQHRPVVNIIQWVNRSFRVGYPDKLLFIASLGFDLSVYDIFGILAAGAATRVVAAKDIKEPHRLLDIIFTEGITFWDSAPASLQQLVPYFYEARNRQDESKLRLVFLSGDWIPVTLPDALKATFPGVKVISLGGATEATIWSNYYPVETVDPTWVSIPYGKPIKNAKYYILDKELNVCPLGVPGDLFIGGECLALEYINDPVLTAQKFIANPFVPDEKMYRTGDMARWFEDGNIEFLGRKDFQVKIRGHRIELGEIETQLLNHEDVEDALVIARDDKGDDKYLCAYVVSKKDKVLDTAVLKEHLTRELPGYMIPPYWIRLNKIPLNPNGKVDRKALPKPQLSIGEEYVAPRNELESKLVKLWSEVLEADRDIIGIDSDYFELGGHSLKATILAARIHKELNIKVPLAILFEKPTIRELAQYMEETEEEKFEPIEPALEKDYYLLSSAQKRMYILHQMEWENVSYNVTTAAMLEGPLEKAKLTDTFKRLIQRHEGLRTSFVVVNDEPRQKVHHQVEFEVECYTICEEEGKEKVKAFVRAFDLEKAPLLRVGLLQICPTKEEQPGNRHILVVDMHHIISDGVSQAVLIHDFLLLYAGEELSPLTIQYKDFSEWQNRAIEKEIIKKQEEYWLKELSFDIPVLDLPIDYKRPPVQSFEGDRVEFIIDAEETGALKALALKEDVTLFMVLLSIYTIFLAKISSQEDILLGTPVAARRHVDLEQVIGMFVNTLVIKNNTGGEKTYRKFLKEVKEKTLAAFENQEYPFEDLVGRISLQRDAGRNPLFDVMFVLQNMGLVREVPDVEMAGLKVTLYGFEKNISKFDLTVEVVETEKDMLVSFEYCIKLFSRETIETFIGYFKKILSSVLEDPSKTIKQVELVSQKEREQILKVFNNTKTQYPDDKTISQLFEEQVAKRTYQVAVVHNHKSLGYRELNERANLLAEVLRENRVKPDSTVAIMIEPSLEMIVGILGILKAGGAYLPIDPGYPGKRIAYMIKDSSATLLLTKASLAAKADIGVPIIYLEDETNYRARISGPAEVNGPGDLAYIIYTSGSTGEPKGVLVEHRSVARLVKNTNYIQFKPDDRLLQTGALEFDASTFEIWGALLNGLPLYLLDKQQLLNTETFKQALEKYEITTIWLTAPFFNQVLTSDSEVFAGLRNLLVGGDILNPYCIAEVKAKFPGLNVINGYGPTENTTFSTTYLIDGDNKDRIPIGKPIANSTVYIVDQYDCLLPIGVAGQLCTGGDGVARGYLNNPQLTWEKFPGNSFFQGKNRAGKGARLYRTGDRARWLPDGNIEFLGRMDFQAKIRGFRIEPAEIENRLLKHPNVKECVVGIRENESGDKYLCAYIVPEEALDVPRLKEYLAQELPGYMVPQHFVQLEKMPLTANGKIDRNVLNTLGLVSGRSVEYVAPKTHLESTIAHIWQEVLGVGNIGVHDNFFEVGGDSLKIVKLSSKLKKTLDKDFPLATLFRYPTIGSFAQYIEGGESKDSLSDEEIDESLNKMEDAMQMFTGAEND